MARQTSLFMGFSRQGLWNGLPCPLPGDLPDPGIEPASPALAGRFFITNATWEAQSAPLSSSKTFPSFQKETPSSLTITPLSLPQPVIVTMFPVPVDLPVLNISYKWNHICPSNQHDVFEVHPCCHMCQCFISFYDWLIFHSMDGSHFVYSLIH